MKSYTVYHIMHSYVCQPFRAVCHQTQTVAAWATRRERLVRAYQTEVATNVGERGVKRVAALRVYTTPTDRRGTSGFVDGCRGRSPVGAALTTITAVTPIVRQEVSCARARPRA